jgi:hypothetical protein
MNDHMVLTPIAAAPLIKFFARRTKVRLFRIDHRDMDFSCGGVRHDRRCKQQNVDAETGEVVSREDMARVTS